MLRIGETPPVKDIPWLSSKKDSVLLNCTKLRSSNHPEDIRKIYITPDLILKEKEINKSLRAKLVDMNKDEKHYCMKNVKIVQRVPQT